MKRLIWFIFSCGMALSPQAAQAANHYVRSGASGTASGADWTNAYTGFGTAAGQIDPSSMVRGDTYYVGNGTYGGGASGINFSTAASGTLVITIKGATAADHGTDTGWSNSYGVDTGTQATFAASTTSGYPAIFFTTSYWILDGNAGTGSTCTTYGFSIGGGCGACDPADYFIFLGNGGNTNNFITFSHLAFFACNTIDEETVAIRSHTTSTENNITITHSLFNGFQVAASAGPTTTGAVSNWTFDHNYVENPASFADHHGALVDIQQATNVVVSNNIFTDCKGTGCVIANDGGSLCATGWNGGSAYGNLFMANSSGGTGEIAATTACYITNVSVYNNTFANSAAGPWWAGCQSGAGTACTDSTGNTLENNLIWNQNCALSGGDSPTHDYNTYESCKDTAPTETHGQTGGVNLFVNSAGENYQLAGDTAAWSSSGVPPGDTLDPLRVLRTSSRGVYQFATTLGSNPQPPQSLAVSVK
ncbi:MAG: hypothetical protein ACYDDI_16690 [Candidatus Acidiferrales bacterium]